MCFKTAYFSKCDLIREVILGRYGNKDMLFSLQRNKQKNSDIIT